MNVEKPIQPVFSYSFQARYCLVMIIGSSLSSLLLYLTLDRGLGGSYFESLLTLNALEENIPTYLAVTFAIQLGLIVLITFIIHLFVSHKIAGPVYRYELTLASLLKNDFRNDVRTRTGDQLKPMVDALNRYIEANRRVYATSQQLVDELKLQLEADQMIETTRLISLAQELRQQLGQTTEVSP